MLNMQQFKNVKSNVYKWILKSDLRAALVLFTLIIIACSLILSTGSLTSEDTDKDGTIDFTELQFTFKKPTADLATWWNYALSVPILAFAGSIIYKIYKKDKKAKPE